MKIVRRCLILLILVANIALLLYWKTGVKVPPVDIVEANVTIVKAREQTQVEEHPDFIKEEYVLVLPEGENVALDKKVEASSFMDVYNGKKVNDGDAKGASYWEGKSDYPNLVTIDLENTTSIHAIRVCLNPLPIWGKRTQTISVKISTDGVDFQEVVSTKQYVFDPDTGNEVQLHFNSVDARFVQLIFTANSGAAGGQAAEIEVYH